MNSISIPTCGAVIFNERGEVLLVEHRDGAGHLTGTFGLPAGKIEPGENALNATVREVQEETGLTILKEELRKLPTIWHAEIKQKDGSKTFSWEIFTATITNGTPTSSDETQSQWVDLETLDSLNLLPNVKNAIIEARVV